MTKILVNQKLYTYKQSVDNLFINDTMYIVPPTKQKAR